MKRVLFIGQEPETVDFSDPALPPGLDAEKIRASITIGMKQITDHGWHVDLCLVPPDESAMKIIGNTLRTGSYDCVVIGAGIRVPPKSMLLFENLINVVHKCAPGASIAFNTKPDDTGNAAARWITKD